ncbi:MAG: hypothetical protein QM783_18075 [Phycisphaerales bacterium]
MNKKMMALAILTLAGTAMAQPASFTDLGNRTAAQTFSQAVTLAAANDVQWFRIQLPAVNALSGYVDIWTSAVGDITDTEIGMYAADGSGAGSATTYFDDDSGPGNFSQLTFGSTTARPNLGGDALARNGSDGQLAGGVYYVAIGRYNVTWNLNFGPVGDYTGPQRTTELSFEIQPATDPYPPTGSGLVTPGTVEPGSTVTYTVTVVPGGNPASTGVNVHGDLSAVGGGANVLFHDDGANGDAAAGDGIYSYQYVIPTGAAGGNYTVPVTVADAQGRSSSVSITGYVFNPEDLGTLVDGTATTVSVSVAPAEVKWYRATISDCSVAAHRNLLVTTANSTNGGDSEIGFYDNGGTLVATNDDAVGLFSRLTFGYQGTSGDVGPGTYFIAVGSYNTAFGNGFSAVSAATATNTFQLDLLQNNSFPATATGAVARVDMANYLMTVNVVPATNPDSTGIAVAADLSAIGGSSSQAFFDDGTHGDATAGDNIYTYTFTSTASTPVGAFAATATVTDQQGTNLSVTLNGRVSMRPESATDLGQIGAAPAAPRSLRPTTPISPAAASPG